MSAAEKPQIRMNEIADYGWAHAHVGSHKHHVPAILAVLASLPNGKSAKILDLGCGNGALTEQLQKAGYDVIGVEPSADGVEIAQRRGLNVVRGSAYDDITSTHGTFDVIVSAEVIEHLYSPHIMLANCFRALKPGGIFIVTTPYHGYLKNVAIAAMGKWDHHHTSTHEHMHIKFFSMATLGSLLQAAGFEILEWKRFGRIPALARSMMAITRRPAR